MRASRTEHIPDANRAPKRSLPPVGWLIALLFLALAQACSLRAQVPFQPDQVDQLVAPIALYPDPLLALLLPASAVPSDIAAAAIYLQHNGDPMQVDSQPWDDSVRALAHYPEVVIWMAQNFAWTEALGTAFLAQPADVIQSIQRLRAEARASGALVSSPEADVVVDADGNIEIDPAQSEVIYVPRYDPDVVYAAGVYDFGAGPCITFGEPFPIGIWLTFGFDWHHRGICVGDWNTWHDRNGWRHPKGGSFGPGGVHRWQPAPGRQGPEPKGPGGADLRTVRPEPMRGAPAALPRNSPRVPQDNRRPGNSSAPAAPGGDHREGVPEVRPGPGPTGQKPIPTGSGAPTAGKPAVGASSGSKGGATGYQAVRSGGPPPSDGRNKDNH